MIVGVIAQLCSNYWLWGNMVDEGTEYMLIPAG